MFGRVFAFHAVILHCQNKMGASPRALVLRRAIQSRCFQVALIILWRAAFTPYDTSASTNPPCLTSQRLASHRSSNNVTSFIGSALENSVVWDSVYFVRIAECQYEYEQSYAFMPLLPLFIHFFSRIVLFPLIPLIGYRAVLALSGYIICNTMFVLSAVYLHRFSVAVLKDRNLALRASILFCFNPASIFYSSIYSESLYSLFSLGGLYYLISDQTNMATLWFAFSACARSNGFINAGYICYITMHQLLNGLNEKRSIYLAVKVLAVGALRSALIFTPFIIFQLYGYYNLCSGHIPGQRSPWCERQIPLLYNYIQSHYWGIGFLKYYELKQLPNMLLATPTLCLAIYSILYFVRLEQESFSSLGLQPPKKTVNPFSFSNNGVSAKPSTGKKLGYRKVMAKENDSVGQSLVQFEKKEYLSCMIVPCIIHMGFLVITALLFMHIQVATRFLSASPPIYWFAASIMGNYSYRRWNYLIWVYSFSYILLGSLLFSNFYPFT